jgi:hypothetical protein
VSVIGRDLWGLILSTRGRLAIVLMASPIGVGAAGTLFPAIAPEWRVEPAVIATITGPGAAMVSALGCLMGGVLADRTDRLSAWLITGWLLVAAGAALALLPRTPPMFALGALAYDFTLGSCFGAFIAVVLEAIGQGAATSKFALVTAFGNVPLLYMAPLDGWAHDHWASVGMLIFEAGICAAGLLLLSLFRNRLGWDPV